MELLARTGHEETAVSKIGYARVSTKGQNDDSQVDELTAAGCDEIFVDHGVSGKHAARPELDKALAYLRPGDVFVITRMSRAMRSLKHMIDLAERAPRAEHRPGGAEAGHRHHQPPGRLVFHIFAAIDEFQRELIVEGTVEGLKAAKARGKLGGRKPSYSPDQAKVARSMHAAGEMTAEEIGQAIGVSRATVYRMIKEPVTPRTGKRTVAGRRAS